jgi:fructokinase
MNKLGIDLGGTKIEGVLLDEAGSILSRERIPTLANEGYSRVLSRITSFIEHMKKKACDKVSVGICTPGSISPHTHLMRNSNTICLNDKPFLLDLEKLLQHKVSIVNDANAFALAEALMGAGKEASLVFGVIMGTGVGGGVVSNGCLIPGRNLITGEWGHHVLHSKGHTCYCGKRGCVETYISGPALERQWQELGGKALPLKEIVDLVVKEPLDHLCMKWKYVFLENFGHALSNVINILDPDVIVLGGGVSNIPFLYDEGIEAIVKNTFSDIFRTKVLKNQLGDSAGVFGAAYLK